MKQIKMGYLVQPECNSGYQHKNIFMGSGMKNYEASCELPFFMRNVETNCRMV
jgi:hypothetical protein